MHVPTEAADIEARLRSAGISINALLEEAGVDRSTWGRWKNGRFQPRLANWLAVSEAASRLLEGEAA